MLEEISCIDNCVNCSTIGFRIVDTYHSDQIGYVTMEIGVGMDRNVVYLNGSMEICDTGFIPVSCVGQLGWTLVWMNIS